MDNRTNTERLPDPDERRREIDATARQIHRTTADLRETVAALQEKLAPDHVAAQVKESVRGATIGRAEDAMADVSHRARQTSNTIVDTIWDNPLPAALAAIGLGWLYKERQRRASYQEADSRYYGGVKGNRRPARPGDYGDVDGGWDQRPEMYHRTDEPGWENPRGVSAPSGYAVGGRMIPDGRQMQGRGDGSTEGVQGMLQDTLATGRDTISGVAGTAQHFAGEVASTSQEVVGDVTDQMRVGMNAVGETAQQQAHYAQRTFDRALHDNPLGMAAIAFGVGAAVGLMTPATSTERRLMGDTSTRFLGQAEEMVQKTVQQTGEQVQQFMDSGQQQPSQHLPPSSASSGGAMQSPPHLSASANPSLDPGTRTGPAQHPGGRVEPGPGLH